MIFEKLPDLSFIVKRLYLIALHGKRKFLKPVMVISLNLGMGSIRILVPAMLANQKAFMDQSLNEMP